MPGVLRETEVGFVTSQALMDPVCCLTCYPQLLSSFIYKGYSWQEATSSFIGFAKAVRFIFSRDLIIAEVRTAKATT